MLARTILTVVAMAAMAMVNSAFAFDDAQYPDLKGQWTRLPTPGVSGQPGYDPSKPWGRGQQAPLTAEYQAKFEASLADQAAGGHGGQQGCSCRSSGMPQPSITPKLSRAPACPTRRAW